MGKFGHTSRSSDSVSAQGMIRIIVTHVKSSFRSLKSSSKERGNLLAFTFTKM